MSAEARAKELFLDALEREPAERAAFVRSSSGHDAALVERVEVLLAAHERAEQRLGRAAEARAEVGDGRAQPDAPREGRARPH